ncbi:DUF86 domain-containing protein [Longibacter salinarum]|uniref:DUF86 domain-containing protein n=1 Tax=Longibacter salinarum TaxID=1850348 RepID=A0A2A8CVD2_9BACT|nr:DUF86 domain-containing protein [Longibacter salinarum]PEN12557.1 DUF86 domain-containing protein [Longibacter salinarum]
MKTDRVYVEHIMDAIHQIEEYTRGVDRQTFEENRMLQDATVRQIEIIGEASRQLSESFRRRVSEVPWRAVIGMRNRLAHDYLNIDLEVVQNDVPLLKDRLSGKG